MSVVHASASRPSDCLLTLFVILFVCKEDNKVRDQNKMLLKNVRQVSWASQNFVGMSHSVDSNVGVVFTNVCQPKQPFTQHAVQQNEIDRFGINHLID